MSSLRHRFSRVLRREALKVASVARWLRIGLFVLAAADAGWAEEIQFVRDVAPILAQQCVMCHGAAKQKGGYRLDTYAAMLRPGESKQAPVVPGKPAESRVFQLITTTNADDRMPQQEDPLSKSQRAAIEQWIREGARADEKFREVALGILITPETHPPPPAAYEHPEPVLAMAFSPTGDRLAINGRREITVWNSTNGVLLERITRLPERVCALAFHPRDGSMAVAGGQPGRAGEVWLLPTSGRKGRRLAVTPDMALAVAFSPDGEHLASGGSDNLIRIFEVASGRLERVLEQHADWVMALAWNAAGTQLASASRDKSARVFDAKSGELEATYMSHGEPVFCVAFFPDGSRVCSAGRDRRLHIWQAKDGKELEKVGGFDGDIHRLAVTSQQIWTASADGAVREHQWAGKKFELRHTWWQQREVLYGLAWDGAHRRLASGAFDGEVRVWGPDEKVGALSFVAAPGYRR